MKYQSELLQKISTHEPSETGLTDGATIELSYRKILQHGYTTAEWLLEQNVQCLAILGDNSIAQVIIDLACIEAGIASLQIPPFFTEQQVTHAIVQTGCSHTLSDKQLSMTAQNFNVAGRQMHFERTPFKPESRLLFGTRKVTFTSGSTSQPKGLCLSEENLMAPVRAITLALEDTPLQTHLSILPQAVLLETVAGIYASLYAGVTCVIPSLEQTAGSSDVGGSLISLCTKHNISSAIAVPDILKKLVTSCEHNGAQLPDLQFIAVGGSRVSTELLQRANDIALPVYQGYGLSEAGSVVTLNIPAANKPQSVGKVLSHQRLSIAENGEILLQQPGYLGYCGSPPTIHFATKNLPTGDIGYIDADGFLHIEGRIKNILITGMGRNVSPEWVESTLLDQPGIEQALVFGDAAPKLSALLVTTLEEDKLQACVEAANSLLPDYAKIGTWYKSSAFTAANGQLTGNGKLKRHAILHAHFPESVAAIS